MAMLGSISNGEKPPTKSEARKFKKDFEKQFKKRAALHLDAILTELENHSPELAAALDSRDIRDVETG